MTNTTDTTVLAGATKYRVGTRERLTAAGWVFTQKSTGTDEYTKDGVVAQFFHGAKNTMTAAEISDGKAPTVIINDGKLKLERAIAKLLGEDPKPWYMTDAELKTLPPLGKGNGLIAVIEAAPAAPKAKVRETPAPKPAPKPAPVPTPKPAARAKASTSKAS